MQIGKILIEFVEDGSIVKTTYLDGSTKEKSFPDDEGNNDLID